MKLRSCILMLVLLLSACNKGSSVTPTVLSAATPFSTATRLLPTVGVTWTVAPDARMALTNFLEAWKAEDYAAMYDMLAQVSRDAISKDDFIKRYKDTAINMTLQTIDYEILSSVVNPGSAQLSYRVNYHTGMVGDLTREMNASLAIDATNNWRIQWDDGMILPELKGGNRVQIDYDAPSRGNIYDRNGNGLALYSESVALGVNIGQMDPNEIGTIAAVVSELTGKPAAAIREVLKDRQPWEYVPLGEITKEVEQAHIQALSALPGLVSSPYTGRLYPDGGIAPHLVGYVSPIQKDEVDQYLRAGYQLSDRVGRAGIEAVYEKTLTGTKGATLDVYNAKGEPVTRLKKVDRKPAQHIYLTIDSQFQMQAQQALSGFTGALVVMERDTGRILAMVSSPTFDPNAFETDNINWQTEVGDIQNDARGPLYNRAVMGAYPLGSVFKVVTISAALETGNKQPDDTLDCQYKWYAPNGSGRFYTDWTYDKGYKPSGILTLMQGLVRSCDPWFYQMGYDMFDSGQNKAVSDMARAYGLGSKTGIDGVDEVAGNIEDPTDWTQAVEMAIGQWTVQVTPLQVARFMAAVGNGGTLYKPQVIEKIADSDGKASFSFKPEAMGKLPVSPAHLQLIQEALHDVTSSPKGTAVQVFGGMSIPVFGKTGTAQTQNDYMGRPHAWFAGYTDAKNPDKPDIAIAVICENAGEGSEIAAPIFRRILEIYFMGQPQKIYPWETKLNITRTPTPIYTPTPPANGGDGGGGNGGNGGNNGNNGNNDVNMRTATPKP